MKKLIILFMLVTIMITSKEHLIKEFIGYEYNEVWGYDMEISLFIKYEDEIDSVLLIQDEMFKDFTFFLNNKDKIDKLKEILIKYNEWKKIAVEKKIKMEKLIGDINSSITWDDTFSDGKADGFILSFTFISDGEKTPHILITSNEVESDFSFSIDDLRLYDDNISILLNGMESLDAFIKDIQIMKQNEKLFQ